MMPPLNYSLTEEVKKHDVLLYYPYQSIRPFILMLKKAARDPDVISIKMTLYRLARESQIVQALVGRRRKRQRGGGPGGAAGPF